ncbi:Bud-site selection protein [Elsinoe ampelina]|uniref:Bud-site selection protein n=1 Tax=Elsinoe ampelina TaxID=302913 RepID=A0A6A6GNT1_9PEZI|nr:Bud-site selection protein [Elsinoe ampelina]
MPKRKRESGSVEGDVEKLESLRTLQAKAKIHHGQNVLHRAFKTAKGFERQKLSRRHKTATSQKDDTAVARINAEIEATKTIDLSKAASNYLAKSLLKIKAVAESPDRPSTLTLPPSQSSDPAVLNVIARLCNSNPVRDVLPKILSDVEQALGIERGSGSTNGTAKKSDARKDGQSKTTTSAEHASARATTRKHSENPTSEDEDDFAGFSGDDNEVAPALDSDDSAAFAAFDSRLASSSDESDPDQPTRPTFDARALLQAHGSDPSASDSDSNSLSSSHSSPQPKKGNRKPLPPTHSRSPSPSPSRSPSPPPTTKPNSSAFLPSLTMGGYISGSGSAEDFSDAAPKKNRRGQRARRAIWEKKFGKEAKHVVTGESGKATGKAGRDEGWDARRGATGGAERGRGKFARGGRGGGMGRGGGGGFRGNKEGAGQKEQSKHRDDEGALHPSWAAAKKRKEEKEKMTAPFQGRKITFD